MLVQDEVPGVVTDLTAKGIIVSAIHNHWIMDDPHLIYLHVEASMEPKEFARRVALVINRLDNGRLQDMDHEEDDD